MPTRGAQAAGRLDLPTRGVIIGLVYEKPTSGLTATYRGGVVRVGNTGDGATPSGTDPGLPTKEYSIAGSTKLFTASKDTYVSVNKSGTLVYTEVANAAAKPTLASLGTDSEFLYKVVTDGSNITSVTRLWQEASHGPFRTESFNASFQTAEKGTANAMRSLPYGGIIRKIESTTNIALANTDTGTATFSIQHDGVATAVTTGVITGAISEALAVRHEVIPTAANIFQPGDAIQMDTAKTTAGGRMEIVLTIEEYPVSK